LINFSILQFDFFQSFHLLRKFFVKIRVFSPNFRPYFIVCLYFRSLIKNKRGSFNWFMSSMMSHISHNSYPFLYFFFANKIKQRRQTIFN